MLKNRLDRAWRAHSGAGYVVGCEVRFAAAGFPRMSGWHMLPGMMGQLDDRELMARDGDAAAFETLYERCKGPLYRYDGESGLTLAELAQFRKANPDHPVRVALAAGEL